MRFWLKFVVSPRLETFIETKCKVCYTIENLSLSIDVIFFVMEFSNFPPSLALHGLQCGMMVKVRDNARSGLDECRTEGQLSKICKDTKS